MDDRRLQPHFFGMAWAKKGTSTLASIMSRPLRGPLAAMKEIRLKGPMPSPGFPSGIDRRANLPVAVRSCPLQAFGNRVLKRIFDILFSIAVLILCSPVFVALAVVVKATSAGPAFFKQKRVGMNDVVFTMYKFRSMIDQNEEDSDIAWTKENDSRITSVGKFIRKTGLDELPQFWNVLVGKMSVVGPRPEREFFVEKFRKRIPHYQARHLVKPGITGLAQVNGWRGDTSIGKRVLFDIDYIENWNFFLDMKIVWLTVFGKSAVLGK